MIALIQRVRHANVVVAEEKIADIGIGIVALIGIEKNDRTEQCEKLLRKLLDYRIFADTEDKMNLSLLDIQGGLLLVPQFTLAANTNKGLRPSFSSAASPSAGSELFHHLVNLANDTYDHVATGKFGANMQVNLCNDGPVTFHLQV